MDGLPLGVDDGPREFCWETHYPGDGEVGLAGTLNEDREGAGTAMLGSILQHELPQQRTRLLPESETDSEAPAPLLPLAGAAQRSRQTSPAPEDRGAGTPPVRGPASEAGPADESGTDTDEDGELLAAAKRAREAQERARAVAAAAGPKRRTGKSRAGGGVTLRLLIEEGILWPGQDVLSVEYKGGLTYASLDADGRIHCHVKGSEMTFESPSAFSIFLKRLINPARKADDGWKTVKFGGKFLEAYKLELARRRFGPPGQEDGSSPAQEGPAAKRLRSSAQNSGAPAAEDVEAAQPVARDSSAASAWPSPAQAAARRGEDDEEYLPGHCANGQPAEPCSGAPARPHRQVRAPRGGPAEAHAMVECVPYPGRRQPFRLEVAPAAELLMDFHAHLSNAEVIGLLAGRWDAVQRVLCVERAVPVRELAVEEDSVNVEMDPEDEVRAAADIASHSGARCVGWYHSHPHFPARPSLIDIHNQAGQQAARGGGGAAGAPDPAPGCAPFVAAIVGPYDTGLPGSASALTWFRVEGIPQRLPPSDTDPLDAGCQPMALQVENGTWAVEDGRIAALPQVDMVPLAQRYASLECRVELGGEWRGGMRRLDKLRASLAARLPGSWPPAAAAAFLAQVDAAIAAIWPDVKGGESGTDDAKAAYGPAHSNGYPGLGLAAGPLLPDGASDEEAATESESQATQ